MRTREGRGTRERREIKDETRKQSNGDRRLKMKGKGFKAVSKQKNRHPMVICKRFFEKQLNAKEMVSTSRER